MREPLTLNEAIQRVARSGYVRIDDAHSASTEEEVREIFGSRMNAWSKAKLPTLDEALREAKRQDMPETPASAKEIAALKAENADLRASVSNIEAMLSKFQAPPEDPNAPPAAPNRFGRAQAPA